MVEDAVILGGGIGGLTAAYRLAAAGLKPVLVEARGRAGGLVCGAPVGGVFVDLGAESYANRSVFINGLVDELGLTKITPGGSSFVVNQQGRAYPIPFGVLGIPAGLDDVDVTSVLSPEGLARAKQDLTMGPKIGAECEDLASFVEARLGTEVLDAFVRPIAGGVHSVDPSQLAVESVTPGLKARLLATGSLTQAAADQRAAAGDAPMVASVEGGLFKLPEAMSAKIVEQGGVLRTRTIVRAISRDADGLWSVTLSPAVPGPTPADDPVPGDDVETLQTRRLIVALPARQAMALLTSIPDLADAGWELPDGADLAGATLALRHPDLDAAPRGSGLLVAPAAPGEPADLRAKALTHFTVKWPWAKTADGPHIVRISYGRAGQPRPDVDVATAVADAARLLGIADLAQEHCEGGIIAHWNDSLPPHTPAHRDRVVALTRRISTVKGLGVVGSWVAGTGLAAVLPHADRVATEMVSA